ncbi:MAG: cytochrome c biogenesis heme-transporting ATPase CcmA, partial [Thiotrichaceae bacterium]
PELPDFTDKTSLLTVEDLQCIRDDRVLFEGLNFTLQTGQILQIEGRNGSGKTSLLRILCGLTLPTEGTVLWKNQDIQSIRLEYCTELSYIGHVPGIKQELTPLENLAITQALGAVTTTIQRDTALSIVGLYGFEDVPTRNLSAGQQRRVALARLLIHHTQLWILDEPFTALDRTAINMVEALLDTHARRGGMVVVTSHHKINCEHATCLHLTEFSE